MVTLDFANADARDVIRSVLGDILGFPYTVDPAVQGPITLRSGGQIPRQQVFGELESALRLAGFAIVDSGGLLKIVPLAQATREARLSSGSAAGFAAHIITPRYVSATSLEKLLEPLVPQGTTLHAEASRNVLIVSGPSQDVNRLLANLAVFDVDTMRGLSMALLPLRNAQARDLIKELDVLLADLGESRDLVRIASLDRLNAILVTSMRPGYIDRVRRWIDSLDKTSNAATHQLFVYNVQNGRAIDLSGVLRKALGLGGGEGDQTGQAAASGASAHDASANGGSTGEAQAGQLGGDHNPLLGGVGAAGTSLGSLSTSDQAGHSDAGAQTGMAQSDIRITADDTNNALLILATPQEYGVIESALRRLDLPPLQVVVEATLAEATLTNQLAYGMQYYLKSGNLQALFAQTASGSTSSLPSGFNFASGLNFAYGSATGSSAVLQLLQQLTQVRVLSSPNILVSNNQSARIQVGDQVPIETGSAVSTVASGAPIVNSIEYRDTGIILKITPRVNASGMVSLDLSEEVSSVSSTTTSSLNSPTISERKLDTKVTVSDGQTVAIGGLISDNRNKSNNGIPGLQTLPGLGWLFGQRSEQITRTELIAILTPHVIRGPTDMHLVTEELQRKLPLTLPVRAGSR